MEDLLAKLDDPAAWVVRTGVPVFKAHEKTFPDGSVKVVTEADLQEWLAQSQELERQTRVCGLFRLGHIRPDLPETQQPPTAGVYRNPRVADVPGFGRRLVMDEWRSKRYADQVPEYPWRSVELYRDKKRITAVAALKRDPQLHDLGPPNLYQYTGPDGLELYSLGGAMADTPPPPAAAAPPPGDIAGQLMPLLQQMMAVLQGGGGAPAPGGPPPEGMSKDAKPELFALQTKLTAVEASNAQLLAAQEKIKGDLAEANVKAVLTGLALERYSFDAAEELKAMLPLDEAGRQKRAAYIRRHYGKLPGDELVELFQGPAEGGTKPKASISREDMQKLNAHCQATGKPFAQARNEYLAGSLKI